MSSVSRLCFSLSLFALLGGLTASTRAQSTFTPEAGEYPLVDPFRIPGDQVRADLAIRADGGFVVWQDNATDGDGMGISARRLNQNLSRELEIFRVNVAGQGDQENPKVALLKDGGAVFVWHGGDGRDSDVYARFLGPNGAFVGGEIRANSFTSGLQVDPAVACLEDGSVVVAWTSFGQDDSLNPGPFRQLPGVYAQRFTAEGEKLGVEFQVNQTVQFGQRNPVIAATAEGGFIVVWISERSLGVNNARNESGVNPEGAGGGLNLYGADVMARRYSAAGEAASAEFLISGAGQRCGSPSIATSADGGVVVAWCQFAGDQVFDGQTYQNGWEIYVRSMNREGSAVTPPLRVNTFTYGDQLYPRIAGVDNQFLVVWTSMSQDGFREGVIGRFVTSAGEFPENEFQVNTTFVGPQLYPSVASDGQSRLLATWSGFVGGVASLDLFGQRYSLTQVLDPPAPPFVLALSQSRLFVSWAEMDGFDVDEYLLYQDDQTSPLTVQSNAVPISGLASGSEHSFRLAYKLSDGRTSPKSSPVTARTWGEDGNFDGLPDDWQELHWGADSKQWPSVQADSDGDGVSDLLEFLADTDPRDADSVLRTRMEADGPTVRLIWNAVPGALYQVQTSTSVGTWTNLGSLRLAVDVADSIPVGGESALKLYRVMRVR